MINKLILISFFCFFSTIGYSVTSSTDTQPSSFKKYLPAILFLLSDETPPQPPELGALTAKQHQLLNTISRQVTENLAYTLPIFRDDNIVNIDGDLHYYDAPLRFQFYLKMAKDADHITSAQVNAYQSELDIYYERLRLAIENGTPTVGGDGVMNTPRESYLRGFTNYYLANKASRQNFKQTVLTEAMSGNIFARNIDNPNSYLYQNDRFRLDYLRPYARIVSSFVQALRIHREDGEAIPAAAQAKLDSALISLKTVSSQFLTGEYTYDKAWGNYTQIFYQGLALTALIDVHDYNEEYGLPQDPELKPLIKAMADQFLLGGGKWYRYDIPQGVVAGDTFEYRAIKAGNPSSNILFTIRDDDLDRGYIQFAVPQATMSTPVSVQLVNGTQSVWSQAPTIKTFRWLNKSSSDAGLWTFRWSDVPNDGVSTSETTVLINFISTTFAWLHKHGLDYGNNQSYEKAYWQTFFSALISGHYPREYFALRSPAGKTLNQVFFNQAKAWEYLDFDASKIIKPQYTSLPPASNGTKMTDVGFTLHPFETGGDDTVIENGKIRMAVSGSVYLKSDYSGLKFRHTLNSSTGTYSDANGLRHSFGDIFFTRHTTDRIRIMAGSGGNPSNVAGLEGNHDLTEGGRYIYSLERVSIQDINPDTQETEKSLFLMHYDNENGTTIGSGVYKHDDTLGTQIGLQFSDGANVDYSSIEYFE